MPIGGDTTRLPYAVGLTPLEKKLALAQVFLAQHMAGSQPLRQLMGHRQFGARVMYGDCVFMTISPNEQHSALVLRLSRFRRNDPYVKYADIKTKHLASMKGPRLEAKRQKTIHFAQEAAMDELDETDRDDIKVELPEYDLRRTATARDPLAVVYGYMIEVYLRLATLLGLRMCPNCPRCNRSSSGCQDKFGNNMRPCGGVLGATVAAGGATEHQGHGTPHLHVQTHVVSIYQFGTMADVVAALRAQKFDFEGLARYQQWFHAESTFDEPVRQEMSETIDY